MPNQVGTILHACATGRLAFEAGHAGAADGAAVTVVMASGGYPGPYETAARRLSRRGEQIEKELGLHLIDRKGLKAWTSRTLALKNQGYHLEHHFGHGQQNLSMIFFVLNLLAFYVHQIMQLTDPLYQKVRYSKFTSRKEYWNQLRCTIRILIFPRWESLLQFILDPESGIPP